MPPGSVESSVWYFAYGANMASTVFATRRRLHALDTRRNVLVPTHELAFNLPGVPYKEPAFANIRPLKIEGGQPVRGAAYQITEPDLARLVASEGGGMAYRVTFLDALTEDGMKFVVVTFVARNLGTKVRCPSQRYMGLLLSGAKEQDLQQQYQDSLSRHPMFTPGTSMRYLLGEALFNAFWLRGLYAFQRRIATSKDETGTVPKWTMMMFNIFRWSMWTYHDYVHAIVWGRGDGL